jgi:tyrosine-protein phosphatase
VAYVMTLAAAGLMPERLGHLRTMQDAYDFVKERSPWIGPNVS